jgi:hypothetical protein
MLMGHFVHMFWQWSLHISYLNNGIEVHDTLAKTFKTLIPKKEKNIQAEISINGSMSMSRG